MRAMLIRHLALQVRDAGASARFYLDVVGLSAEPTREEWGVRLSSADGFMLALIEGEPLPRDVAGRVHFGFALNSPDEARAVRRRLIDAKATEVEWFDEARYVGTKIEDPDGYVVECSYDADS
ncbi:MAG: Glyoxalase/bleomycin resistance protein/dioxygenase [Actinomycetia bacterium]|nr:Glyoxalase/bleomycin resistance protein/dioxygenase [Actinomycetes bacterium]